MGYRQNLINTFISRLKTGLVWGNKVVFILKKLYSFNWEIVRS